MPALHVVTGAGPVGWTVAELLAEQGHRVRVLTRSGSGPEHPAVERIKADVSQPGQLAVHVDGAVAVYHCIHGSKYSAKVWRAELPAAERVVLTAADTTGAVVVFPESLYSYGKVDGMMTEDTPRTATTGKLGVRTDRPAAGPRRIEHTHRQRRGVGLLRPASAHRPHGRTGGAAGSGRQDRPGDRQRRRAPLVHLRTRLRGGHHCPERGFSAPNVSTERR